MTSSIRAASPAYAAGGLPAPRLVLTPSGGSDSGRRVHQAEVEQRIVAGHADALRGLLQNGANLRWCKGAGYSVYGRMSREGPAGTARRTLRAPLFHRELLESYHG